MKSYITVDENRCNGCGLCVSECFSAMISLKDQKAHVIQGRTCLECGHCGAVCPQNAISYNAVIDEVIDYSVDQYQLDPVKLQAFLKMKRSIRKYKDTEVEIGKINQILDIGRLSPTGSNSQTLEFTVVHSKEQLEKFKLLCMKTLAKYGESIGGRYKKIFTDMYENYEKTGKDRLFYNAPCLVVIHSRKANASVDGGIAAGQMTLMGEALGLGSCYIGFVNVAAAQNAEIYEFLQIPEGNKIVTSMIYGYKDVNFYRTVPRKKLTVNYL